MPARCELLGRELHDTAAHRSIRHVAGQLLDLIVTLLDSVTVASFRRCAACHVRIASSRHSRRQRCAANNRNPRSAKWHCIGVLSWRCCSSVCIRATSAKYYLNREVHLFSGVIEVCTKKDFMVTHMSNTEETVNACEFV